LIRARRLRPPRALPFAPLRRAASPLAARLLPLPLRETPPLFIARDLEALPRIFMCSAGTPLGPATFAALLRLRRLFFLL
jgi:hypothetical protein